MGCDIHLYREKKVNGKWQTAESWSDRYGEGVLDVNWEDRYTGRNYNLFGLLSKGVRRDHDLAVEQRGVPEDACPEYKALVDNWNVDGHSHSWMTLTELKELQQRLKENKTTITGMMDKEQLEQLMAESVKENPDWNLLYPYCQWTNDSSAVKFSIKVPSDFILGEGLEEIIKMLESVDGEEQRITYFFDN